MFTRKTQLKSPHSGLKGEAQPDRSKLFNSSLWLQSISFLLGLILLIGLIYTIGFNKVFGILAQIGWGLGLVIALNGARHLIRAYCIYLAIPPEHRTFKFRYAFAARLAGEAVSVVTFTGPFLGDATKAALLKKQIPLTQSGAAVIVDDIIYYFSVITIIIGGVIAMAYSFSNENTMKYALSGISVCAVLGIFGLGAMLNYRVKPFTWLIKTYSTSRYLPKSLIKKANWINELEDNVYQMYTYRRTMFFKVLGLNFIAHALSVAEVYSIILMLGRAVNIEVAFIIEALTKVINFAFSFIPGMIGVYEGGNGIILKALGYTTAFGVALALVRRGSILFWAFVGLTILLWQTVATGTKKLKGRSLKV